MKKLRLSIVLLLLLGGLSCKKTDSGTTTTSISTDQAADMVAGSLSVNSEGFATVADDIATNAQIVNSVSFSTKSVNSLGTNAVYQECGTTRIDSVDRAGASNLVTYDYFFKYSHTLNCNANSQPDNLVNTLTFNGNYDGPRLSVTGTGTANITIAGLTSTATVFVINGEYQRTGSFQSKVGNKASGNSVIDIKATNVTLSKPARKITGGTATISITGTWPKGAFSYTGTIKFNGDSTATVTINGTIYLVNLVTGVATKS